MVNLADFKDLAAARLREALSTLQADAIELLRNMVACPAHYERQRAALDMPDDFWLDTEATGAFECCGALPADDQQCAHRVDDTEISDHAKRPRRRGSRGGRKRRKGRG